MKRITEYSYALATHIAFRRCPDCRERNLVKDSWLVCQLCGSDLPEEWNFLT